MFKRLAFAATLALAVAPDASAQGSLSYLGETVRLGSGFGSQSSILLTLQSPRNGTTESGCVGWGTVTTNCGFTNVGADVGNPKGEFLYFSDFVNLTAQDFRLVLNGNEPGSRDGLTIDALQVRLWGSSDPANTITFDLRASDLGEYSAGQGLGEQGVVFGVTPDSWSLFDTFVANNPNGGLGAGAIFQNATGGPEYLAAFVEQPAAQVPEPSSFALVAAGLAGLGYVARRRHNRP